MIQRKLLRSWIVAVCLGVVFAGAGPARAAKLNKLGVPEVPEFNDPLTSLRELLFTQKNGLVWPVRRFDGKAFDVTSRQNLELASTATYMLVSPRNPKSAVSVTFVANGNVILHGAPLFPARFHVLGRVLSSEGQDRCFDLEGEESCFEATEGVFYLREKDSSLADRVEQAKAAKASRVPTRFWGIATWNGIAQTILFYDENVETLEFGNTQLTQRGVFTNIPATQ